VRQEIPVERIWWTRGRVGSEEIGRVGGVREVESGGVEDDEEFEAEGSARSVEVEGGEEEEGRGSKRILASMGRFVDSTKAVKI